MIFTSSFAQFKNGGFELWDTIVDQGSSFEIPAFWITNNSATNFGPVYTPVTREAYSEGFYARLETSTEGLDDIGSAYLFQSVSSEGLSRISYFSQCDSIEAKGECRVELLNIQTGERFYSEITNEESTSFSKSTIEIDESWLTNLDSLTILFTAYGSDPESGLDEFGYSIFFVDDVVADFTLSTDSAEENRLKLYPNPASDFLKVDCFESISKVSIFNISGQKLNLVYEQNRLDLNSLPSGVYFLILETEKRVFSERFIIQK